MMNQRKEYIDRLKGVLILMVIILHASYSVLGLSDNYLSFLFGPVVMPIFMFLSGLVIKEPPSAGKLGLKLVRFWSPFIFIGLIFAFCSMGVKGLNDFFLSNFKLGYWYLYVLGIFYLILYLIRFNSEDRTPRGIFVDITLLFGLMALFYCFEKAFPTILADVFSIQLCRQNWSFFYAGYIIRKYQLAQFLFDNDRLYALSLTAIVPLFYLQGLNPHFYILISLCLIIILFYLFRQRNNIHTLAENELSRLGRRSMDIYVLHYFFVRLNGSFRFRELGLWFYNTDNKLLEFVFLVFLSVFIAYLCLLLGNVLRRSKLLCVIIFGERNVR